MTKQSEKRILSYFRLNEKEKLSAFIEESSLEILKTKQLAVGYAHVAMINENGTVTAFGNNEYNQCDTADWKSIIKVAAGDFHTVGLQRNGTVVAAGDNKYGQCNVGSWRNITEIYADKGLTVGVDSYGKLHFSKEAAPAYPNADTDAGSAASDKKENGADSLACSNPSAQNHRHLNPVFSLQDNAPFHQQDQFEYDKMSDGFFRITKYLGSDPIVTIPPNVVSIGYRVFYENKTIETIHIPDSVRLIGAEAFALCPRLKELKLPDHLTQIGKNIVYDNTTLLCSANSKTADLLIKSRIPFYYS